MEKTLTIIVPVWNTEEPYLKRCLLSLKDPGIDDYDVIVVDDGSNLSSSLTYQAMIKDLPENFSYIRQDNCGQNAARNAGVRACESKYVSFVDSDDYLSENAIRSLLGLLKNETMDMLVFGSQTEEHLKESDTSSFDGQASRVDSKSLRKMVSHQCSLFGVAFSRQLLLERPLFEDLHIAEDFSSVTTLLSFSRSVFKINAPFYVYCIRPTSITQSVNYPYPLEIINAFEHLFEEKVVDSFPDEIEWQAINHLLYWEPLRLSNSKMLVRKNKEKLASYMDRRFPNWKQNPYYLEKVNKAPLSFSLLTTGRWRTYQILKSLKGVFTHDRNEPSSISQIEERHIKEQS